VEFIEIQGWEWISHDSSKFMDKNGVQGQNPNVSKLKRKSGVHKSQDGSGFPQKFEDLSGIHQNSTTKLEFLKI